MFMFSVAHKYTDLLPDAKNLGIRAAKKNLPDTKSTVADNNEQHILSGFHSAKEQADREQIKALEEIDSQQNQLIAQIEPQNIRQFYDAANHALSILEATYLSVLQQAKEEKALLALELKLFMDKHGLRRAPVQPDSLIWHYTLAIFFILIETIPNGTILGDGLPGGLIAGLIQALTISALSVILSFVMGHAMRGLFHISIWRKVFTGLLGLAYLGALFTYHLTVAHLRMAMILAPDNDPYTVAIRRVLNLPFSITSFDSYMLIIIGMSFGIAALIAGMKTKDSFPGFTDKYKRLEDARERLHSLVLNYIDDLNQTMEQHLMAPKLWFDEILQSTHTYREGIEEKRRIINGYLRKIEEINDLYYYAILLYRHSNETDRTDDPPTFFSKPILKPFDANVLLGPIYQQLEMNELKLLSLEKMKDNLRKEVVGVQRQIFDLWEDAINKARNAFTTDSMLKGKSA